MHRALLQRHCLRQVAICVLLLVSIHARPVSGLSKEQRKEARKAATDSLSRHVAQRHDSQHGVQLPDAAFTAAVRGAALKLPCTADASRASVTDHAQDVRCSRQFVIMSMASGMALTHTTPLLLESLGRIRLAGTDDQHGSFHGRASGRSVQQGSMQLGHMQQQARGADGIAIRQLRSSRLSQQGAHTPETETETGSSQGINESLEAGNPEEGEPVNYDEDDEDGEEEGAPIKEVAAVSSKTTNSAVLADTDFEWRSQEQGLAGSHLARHMVLMNWSEEDLEMCTSLAKRYSNRCSLDRLHAGLNSKAEHVFRTEGFYALGYAKVRYILNTLSLDIDVLFLDSDVVMLQDPIPYLMGLHADASVTPEKCKVMDDRLPWEAKQSLNISTLTLNIGVMHFRATPASLRCVDSWFVSMRDLIRKRKSVWDQLAYRNVFHVCAPALGLRWRLIDNRRFMSHCFGGCGARYTDEERTTRLGKVADLRPYTRYVNNGSTPTSTQQARVCMPEDRTDWLFVHFPCSGETIAKGRLMQALLEGTRLGLPSAMDMTDKDS